MSQRAKLSFLPNDQMKGHGATSNSAAASKTPALSELSSRVFAGLSALYVYSSTGAGRAGLQVPFFAFTCWKCSNQSASQHGSPYFIDTVPLSHACCREGSCQLVS